MPIHIYPYTYTEGQSLELPKDFKPQELLPIAAEILKIREVEELWLLIS